MSRFTLPKALFRCLVGALLVAFVAGPADACPVCFGASDSRVLHAFYASTVFLTLLPFLLVGASVLYLYRQANSRVKELRRRATLRESPAENK
jgi:hypothetical protein